MLFFETNQKDSLATVTQNLENNLSSLNEEFKHNFIFSESSDFAFLNEGIDVKEKFSKIIDKVKKLWESFVSWIKSIFEKIMLRIKKIKNKGIELDSNIKTTLREVIYFQLKRSPREIVAEIKKFVKSSTSEEIDMEIEDLKDLDRCFIEAFNNNEDLITVEYNKAIKTLENLLKEYKDMLRLVENYYRSILNKRPKSDTDVSLFYKKVKYLQTLINSIKIRITAVYQTLGSVTLIEY